VERALPRTLTEGAAGDGGPTLAFHLNLKFIGILFSFPEILANLRQITK